MSPGANPTIVLKAPATDSQAAQLQERLTKSNLQAEYQEEQHGSVLMVSVRCPPVHEKAVTKLMKDLGLRILDSH